MLVSRGVLLGLVYSGLFFAALLIRKQWIENDALPFPLVQLPLQMIEVSGNDTFPPTAKFWSNRTLWIGVSCAFFLHLLWGLHNYFPDWPLISAFQGNPFVLATNR